MLRWLCVVFAVAGLGNAATTLVDVSQAVVTVTGGFGVVRDGERLDALINSWLIPEVCSRSPRGCWTWLAKGFVEQPETVRFNVVIVGNTTPRLQGTCADGSETTLLAAPEGFHLCHNDRTLTLATATIAGLRVGIGKLLRQLQYETSSVSVPYGLDILHTDAQYPVRGHQFGTWAFAFKNMSVAEQHIKDLMVFGTNQIEFAHIKLSESKIPEQLVEYAAILDKYDVNVSIWYTLDLFMGANEALTEDLFRKMSRLDTIFVPGGDGGPSFPPAEFLSYVKNLTVVLKKYHPNATMWMSVQGFTVADLDTLFELFDTADVRSYLTGIVNGPHVAISLKQLVESLPAGYPVRQYPDIGHSLSCQYSIPNWSFAWAMTHGRQAVSPMPMMHSNIATLRGNATYRTRLIGFGAYSEGANDDLNKCIWSAIGSNTTANVYDIVREYSRYFFSSAIADGMYNILFGLEADWFGDAATNEHVSQTLTEMQGVEQKASASELAFNWRLQMYIFRAYYDLHVHLRYKAEVNMVTECMDILSLATLDGVSKTLPAARQALDIPLSLRKYLDQILNKLFKLFFQLQDTIGVEVLQCQEPTMNLATIILSITDREFLMYQLGLIGNITTGEAAQLDAIKALVNYTDPGPGGVYVRLGDIGPNGELSPYIDPGEGAMTDPDFFFTPIIAFDTDLPWTTEFNRTAHYHFAYILYANPLTLRFPNLDPTANYTLKIMFWASGGGEEPVKLVSGDVILRDFFHKPVPPAPVVLSIPFNLTSSGQPLQVSCEQRAGLGGSGRNCQISEAWLIRN